MMDSDSLPAEPLSFGEAAAEDEARAGRVEDAAAVPSGPGIAAAGNGEADEGAGPAGAAAGASGDDLDRTDDPMTLYLRDVGGTPLLTREGEAALAKRIEAGRRTMLHGPCRARPRALPAALPPAQTPRRLRTAGVAGDDFPNFDASELDLVK